MIPSSSSSHNNDASHAKLRRAAQSTASIFCAGSVIGALLGCMLFRQPATPYSFETSMEVSVTPPVSQHQQQTLLLNIQVPPRDYNVAHQPNITVTNTKPLFSTLPVDKRKTFYAHNSKICQGMVRALVELGWTRVHSKKEARLLWTYVRMTKWYTTLQPWQRYNHVPKTYHWNHKDKMARGFKMYGKTSNRKQYFLPETFDLNKKEEREEFRIRLFQHDGMQYPWVLKQPNVNQGKGITMLGPNSKELEDVFETAKGDDYIVQQYVCNEMTWEHRKFDVRMYWFVATTDPLIVLYIDGYVRIGNANYDESDFSNTRNHLTTHTFLGAEGKASWKQFEDRILQQYNSSEKLKKRIQDPVAHVRNQFKESIAQLSDAFQNKTFKSDGMSSEDCFELYGADYILDNDLDVWLIEAQDDTGMDEDHYFRLDMHHQIYYGMATTLEEIWDKQLHKKPILPLHNTGQWEVVYADGWKYEYDGYERNFHEKQSCSVGKKS